MVPDDSRTIMSLVTIVLHVKRVLTNDKGEPTYAKLQITDLGLAKRPCAHNDSELCIDTHVRARAHIHAYVA